VEAVYHPTIGSAYPCLLINAFPTFNHCEGNFACRCLPLPVTACHSLPLTATDSWFICTYVPLSLDDYHRLQLPGHWLAMPVTSSYKSFHRLARTILKTIYFLLYTTRHWPFYGITLPVTSLAEPSRAAFGHCLVQCTAACCCATLLATAWHSVMLATGRPCPYHSLSLPAPACH
jgi:hypothetical protein